LTTTVTPDMLSSKMDLSVRALVGGGGALELLPVGRKSRAKLQASRIAIPDHPRRDG